MNDVIQINDIKTTKLINIVFLITFKKIKKRKIIIKSRAREVLSPERNIIIKYKLKKITMKYLFSEMLRLV